jgi:hypothetical protein
MKNKDKQIMDEDLEDIAKCVRSMSNGCMDSCLLTFAIMAAIIITIAAAIKFIWG